MKRIILSILAGFLTTAVLSTVVDHLLHTTGVFPPYGVPFFNTALVLMAFTYRGVFAVIGAYITASVAKDQAKRAVLILGIVGSLLWLVGGIMMWDYAPVWYNVSDAIFGLPFALLGAKLYEVRTQAKVVGG